MKLFLCFLSVLAQVAVLVTAPMEDRSQDVLNFLNGVLNVLPLKESTSSGEINAPEKTFGKPDTNPARQNDSRPTENSVEMSDVTQSSNVADLPAVDYLPACVDSDARSKEINSDDLTGEDDYKIPKEKIKQTDCVDSDARSKEITSDDLTETRRVVRKNNSAGNMGGETPDLVLDVTTVNPSAEIQATNGGKKTNSTRPADLGKYTQPSARTTIDPEDVDDMRTTPRQESTSWRKEQSTGTARRGRERTSRELVDPHSEETVMPECQGAACVSPELGTRVRGVQNGAETDRNPGPENGDDQSQVLIGSTTGQDLCANSCRSVANDMLETSGRQLDLDIVENVSSKSNDHLIDDVNRSVLGQPPGTPARSLSVPEPPARLHRLDQAAESPSNTRDHDKDAVVDDTSAGLRPQAKESAALLCSTCDSKWRAADHASN
ncbi:hypothetical protein DPEC_G00139460 [Dallia pectoralis]|uniref:Uncharacterized protein n=1 Tax=Dallia pectoralis TaxID=75939 RepID=A0ACC2GM82_DALPE|nr:hypothetical protein DPEC_G00139460 [Dallia pectoralis]